MLGGVEGLGLVVEDYEGLLEPLEGAGCIWKLVLVWVEQLGPVAVCSPGALLSVARLGADGRQDLIATASTELSTPRQE